MPLYFVSSKDDYMQKDIPLKQMRPNDVTQSNFAFVSLGNNIPNSTLKTAEYNYDQKCENV